VPPSARAFFEGNANTPNAAMAGARAVFPAYRALAILESLEPGEVLTPKEQVDFNILASILYGISSALLMHDQPPSEYAPPEIKERVESLGSDPAVLTMEAQWTLLNAVHLLPQEPSRAAHCLLTFTRLLNKMGAVTLAADFSYPSIYRYRPLNGYDRLIYLTLHALASNILPGVGSQAAVPSAAHWSQLTELWKRQLKRQTGTKDTNQTEWVKLDAVATEHPEATGVEVCKVLITTTVQAPRSVHKFTLALIKALGALQLRAPIQTDFEFFPELPAAR